MNITKTLNNGYSVEHEYEWSLHLYIPLGMIGLLLCFAIHHFFGDHFQSEDQETYFIFLGPWLFAMFGYFAFHFLMEYLWGNSGVDPKDLNSLKAMPLPDEIGEKLHQGITNRDIKRFIPEINNYFERR